MDGGTNIQDLPELPVEFMVGLVKDVALVHKSTLRIPAYQPAEVFAGSNACRVQEARVRAGRRVGAGMRERFRRRSKIDHTLVPLAGGHEVLDERIGDAKVLAKVAALAVRVPMKVSHIFGAELADPVEDSVVSRGSARRERVDLIKVCWDSVGPLQYGIPRHGHRRSISIVVLFQRSQCRFALRQEVDVRVHLLEFVNE